STVAFGLLALLSTGCASSNAPGPAPSSAPAPSSSATPVSASSLAPVNGTYSPSIDPANFVTTIDNPYWPLKPGTTYHYKGVRGTTPQTDDETVTSQTKTIIGIPSVQVNDVVSEHGTPVERTRDYYAQDKWGNVWYMGKHTGLLVTSERSPLEPQTEQKYYEPGLGEVMEKVVKGHHEAFQLVNITH